MTCIYTGDDESFCTCSSCRRRREPVLEHGHKPSQVPTRPFIHRRRRPCPTGIPGSLDGTVPYQPSPCANGCRCCAWCRGEEGAEHPVWCHCESAVPESNCVRGHSGLLEYRGGCKPRPIAKAIVKSTGTKRSWWRRLATRLFGPPRAVARCARCGEVLEGQRLPRGTMYVCTGQVNLAGRGRPAALVCVRLRVVLG